MKEEIHRLIYYICLGKRTVKTIYSLEISAVILPYLEMTFSKLLRESSPKVLSEVLSLPQGKGIDSFIHYISRAKPLVKKTFRIE